MKKLFPKENKATGRKADVILAAYNAAEAALRHLKPGSSVSRFDAIRIFIDAIRIFFFD